MQRDGDPVSPPDLRNQPVEDMRGGRTTGHVRIILGISLVLVIIGFVVSFVFA